VAQESEARLLTVEEVVERLRVHPYTVRKWLREGKLKGFRLGGAKAGWRIPETEISRLREQQAS
jgi:excisionase family DNA binding protein